MKCDRHTHQNSMPFLVVFTILKPRKQILEVSIFLMLYVVGLSFGADQLLSLCPECSATGMG